MWNYTGTQRPEFALEPGPGQESVWDYPRPPVLVDSAQLVEVYDGNNMVASSTATKRVLETASPPTIYIPAEDIAMSLLLRASGHSFCEWKGAAQYWRLANAPNGEAIGWSYPDPRPPFTDIRDWLCFYPGRIACFIDQERVRPQEGGFYGGWVTANITGPWKGSPGTSNW